MTRMLQSMKHRGPDSTGYALYGKPENGNLVMRYKLADANTPRDFDFEDRLRRHRTEVEARLAVLGARDQESEEETPYAFRVSFEYDGDLKLLADFVEDIPEAEVLSLGRSLEIVKDLGDAESVARAVRARRSSPARTRSATSGWRPSPRSTSPARTRTGRTRTPDVAVVHNGQLTNYFHVAPPPRARRPPLHVRVRLGDHRRLPRRGDDEGRLARGRDAASRSTSSTASSRTSR